MLFIKGFYIYVQNDDVQAFIPALPDTGIIDYSELNSGSDKEQACYKNIQYSGVFWLNMVFGFRNKSVSRLSPKHYFSILP